MLLEVIQARQIPGDYLRRCFSDENLDLVVWYEPDHTIHGFQLSYDPANQPRALTWTKDRGFSHDQIDDGETSPLVNRSPMLAPCKNFDSALVGGGFLSSSRNLPTPIRDFIWHKIRQFERVSRPARWDYSLLGLSLGFMAGIGFFVSLVMAAEWLREPER